MKKIYENIEELYKIKSVTELSKLYNVSETSIRNKIKALGIIKKIRPYENYQEILNMYSLKIDTKIIADKFNCSMSCIQKILNNNNIKVDNIKFAINRKITYNEYFFDKIDTEEKSYFLGLLFADGYNNTKNNTISLRLTDKELIESYKKAIEYSNDIKILEFPKNPNKKIQYKIVIGSKHMSNMLVQYGIIPNKAKLSNFPTEDQIPKELQRHFIRGYFDGDGTVYNKEFCKNPSFGMLGSYKFLEEIQKILITNCNLNKTKLYQHKSTDYIYILSYTGRFNLPKFSEWLYKDSTIHLQRKFDKFYI